MILALGGAVSRWGDPQTVAGFSRSQPNARLLEFVDTHRGPTGRPKVLDLGCGAGRNAVPLAARGCTVLGTDIEWSMLEAAARRGRDHGVDSHAQWVLAPMDRLPVPDCTFDVIVAHGIWNLAASGAEFRRALGEAGRAGRWRKSAIWLVNGNPSSHQVAKAIALPQVWL